MTTIIILGTLAALAFAGLTVAVCVMASSLADASDRQSLSIERLVSVVSLDERDRLEKVKLEAQARAVEDYARAHRDRPSPGVPDEMDEINVA